MNIKKLSKPKTFKSSKYTGGTPKAGERAGFFNPETGYRHIVINGVDYFEHDLVWLYIYGEMPDAPLEHIDGDKTNNRVANLRKIS